MGISEIVALAIAIAAGQVLCALVMCKLYTTEWCKKWMKTALKDTMDQTAEAAFYAQEKFEKLEKELEEKENNV